jgi:hypothetical protein
LATTDPGTSIYGITARAFPVSQTTGGMNATFGAAVAATNGVTDVVTAGYVLVPVVGAPTKFAPVYVWIAAAGAGHVVGGFEAAASGASTALLANALFNGTADATGVAEIHIK